MYNQGRYYNEHYSIFNRHQITMAVTLTKKSLTIKSLSKRSITKKHHKEAYHKEAKAHQASTCFRNPRCPHPRFERNACFSYSPNSWLDECNCHINVCLPCRTSLSQSAPVPPHIGTQPEGRSWLLPHRVAGRI